MSTHVVFVTWWDASYGVNQWQHTQAYNTPDNAAQGGQVISFPGFTSIRGGVEVQNRVAYNYPATSPVDNEGNTVQGFPTYFGAIDTPIEYVQKMEQQRDLLIGTYENVIEINGSWYEDKVAIEPQPTEEQQVENSVFINGIWYEGTELLPDNLQNIGQLLAGWDSAIAPGHYRNYLPQSWEAFPEEIVTDLQPLVPFVPNIGLTNYGHNDNYQVTAAQRVAIRDDMFIDDEAAWAGIMAGVDCIGFAQGAFDYSGNPYSWVSLNDGHGRQYPHANAGRSEIIERNNSDDEIQLFNHLRYAKPGDIIYYDSSHIMIVERIEIENGSIVISDIKIIESVFNSNIAFILSESSGDQARTLESLSDKAWELVRLKK